MKMRASFQIMVNSEMMTKATGVVSKLQQDARGPAGYFPPQII